MKLFRNLAAVFLFFVALSTGVAGRSTTPPWTALYCNGQHLHWGLEPFTDNCTDIVQFCGDWCGDTPYGSWCSSHGNGLTDGGCMCVPQCA
jgi:hypothetical protein